LSRIITGWWELDLRLWSWDKAIILPMEKSKLTETEKVRQVKSKVKCMLIISFDIKGIAHKEFVLASQTVNSTYYSDILQQLHKNVRRLLPEFSWQKNWLLHHDNAPSHIPFSRNFFTKNNINVVPHPPYSPDLAPYDFSLFPWLKLKLKGRCFDTTDKGMVRSDGSKPALIFFFHCKSTHNKIHYQNSSC
jgi:transposase